MFFTFFSGQRLVSLPPLDWRMPQRIVSVRRPAPLHLQKLVEARKPRVPPSELPRGATGIDFPFSHCRLGRARLADRAYSYSPIHKANSRIVAPPSRSGAVARPTTLPCRSTHPRGHRLTTSRSSPPLTQRATAEPLPAAAQAAYR